LPFEAQAVIPVQCEKNETTEMCLEARLVVHRGRNRRCDQRRRLCDSLLLRERVRERERERERKHLVMDPEQAAQNLVMKPGRPCPAACGRLCRCRPSGHGTRSAPHALSQRGCAYASSEHCAAAGDHVAAAPAQGLPQATTTSMSTAASLGGRSVEKCLLCLKL
jgi:hypothetical protein